MARKPRKPTSAELIRSQAKTGAMIREDARLSPSSKPRTVVRVTPDQADRSRSSSQQARDRREVNRVVAQAKARTQLPPDQADRMRSPAQRAADARYVQTPEYLRRVQAARLVPVAPAGERRRNKGQYGALGILHPWTRVSPQQELQARDFEAMQRGGRDVPRTDAELRAFLKTGTPPVRKESAWHQARVKTQAERTQRLAPAVSVLQQLSRGNYASAGAARALIRGENVGRAAVRGARLKDHYQYGDVLREAGWRPKGGLGKVAESVVGTALDIGLDPVSYATVGTASVARKLALSAARDAAEAESRRVLARELAAGASRAQARRTAKTAGAKAGASAYEQRMAAATAGERETVPHASIGIGRARVGTPVKGGAAVRRGGRSARQATARQVERVAPNTVARSRAAGLKSRQIASELNALVRPPGMSAEQFARSREIARSKRATAEQVARRGQQRAWALRALTRPGEYKLIRDAIEANDLARLKGIAKPIALSPRVIRGRAQVKRLARDPDRLYVLARHFSDDLTATRERAVTAGVPVGFVGQKPPVSVPPVTADVQGARRSLGAASRQRARAEREAIDQAQPGRSPGALTPAQATRAQRQLNRAVAAKRGHLTEFTRLTRQAAKVSPGAAKRLRLQAQAARGRARVAQDQIDHWASVLGKRRRPSRRVVSEQGDIVNAPAPSRAAVPAAKARERAARQALADTVGHARAQRLARARAQRLAERRAQEAKGYVPRIPRERIEQRGPLTVEDVVEQTTRHVQGGAKRPRPSQRRTVTEPMATIEARAAAGDEIAQHYLDAHSTDLPLVAQAYHAGMGRGIASAEANRALVAEGRPILPGQAIKLAPGERVYAHEGSDLREVKAHDADELRAIEHGDATGAYVALPRAMVEHLTATAASTPNGVGAAWDYLQNHWRRLALASPSYLMRNMFGDAFAAYGAQDPARLARNYVRGQRTLNEYARTERAYKWFQSTMEDGGKGTTTTVNGLPIRYRDLALEAEAAGAIRQGRLAEIRDSARTRKPLSQLKVGTSAWSRAVERVEDSARLATYIGARERGLSAEQAAAQVAKVHFDYGELTRLEKQFRRAAGFYTFPTRNLPRMAALLASKPGKLAAAEKAREEFQKTSGLPADYLEGLDPFEARQMGLPIRLGKQVFTVSAGQPFIDLNDLTPNNLVYRELGLVTPLAKMPVELLLNSSAFYRGPIKDGKPRTPVPAPVARLADRSPAIRERLGIKRIKTADGQLVWGWDKKLDYGIRQVLPGLFGAAYRVSQKPSARGFGPGGEVFGTLTGVRAKPYDAEQAANNPVYARLKALQAQRVELNQAGIYAENATPEWRRVSAEIRALQARIDGKRSAARPPGGLVRVPAPQLRGARSGAAPGLVR